MISTRCVKDYIDLLAGFVSDKVQTLLDTMTELSRILYSRPEERCPRSILRLHNQSFLHAIACEEVIGKPQILTEKKFYGRYLHSLVVHAPIQHRIICSRSTNTEQQERHFNTFSSISTATSSRRPGEIITPGIIRMQAEMTSEETKQRDTVKEQESRLGKLAQCLPPAQNTVIPHRIILKYPHVYQVHLEKVSDFLLCGEGIWWRHILTGVEFLDGPEERETNDHGPPFHHFRTHTLKSEDQYLRKCWKQCLSNQVPIPHHAVRIYDEDGNLESIKYTGFLENNDDNESINDEIIEDNNSCNDIQEDNNSYCDGVQQQDEDADDNIVNFQQVGEDLIEPENVEDEIMEANNQEEPPMAEAASNLAQDEGVKITKGPTNQSPIPAKPATERYKLKSTIAKNVAKVLGETKEVMTFDKLRSQLRQNMENKSAQENYEASLAAVQTQVLAKHSSVKKQFKEWERWFFIENECNEPTLDDIRTDERGHDLYKSLRLCKQLLEHWNITVHL